MRQSAGSQRKDRISIKYDLRTRFYFISGILEAKSMIE